MLSKNTIYACDQHIEIALDDFVNKYEKAPEIFQVLNHKCSYCEKKATYEIKFIEINN